MDLNVAESSQEKLAALARLQEMDLNGVRREMDDCPEEQYHGKLSFAVKVMVLRLAEIDPLAAVDFISERWAGQDNELLQIGPQVAADWAHQDSIGFFEFWEANEKTRKHDLRVGRDELWEIMLAGNPSGYMALYHSTFEDTFRFERFTSALKSEEDFRGVLDTWRYPTERVKRDWGMLKKALMRNKEFNRFEHRWTPIKNILVQEVIRRWREVDEEGFLRSEFVEWEKGE